MINDTPRCLVTGRSRSGSWAIRGEQLGAAIGAAAIELRASKVKGYDLAILVKRPAPDLLYRLQSTGVPIVWDVVDAWPQPDGNSWGRETCLTWLRNEVKTIKPIAIVASTRAMAVDCEEFCVPVLYLPHHARQNQARNPIRLHVQALGYEGGAQHLGHWREWLEGECAARGWRFLINPSHLFDLDIVVAFRYLNGYATTHWKSNVKLANAQATGTPCILNRESGYLETANGGENWANDIPELMVAMDDLTPVETRRQCSARLDSSAVQLERLAGVYKRWLAQLKY